MAAAKLIHNLWRVNFLPKCLISIGIVAKPTIVKVVINAAIAVRLAPLSCKDLDSGKAINAGIIVIVPITAP